VKDDVVRLDGMSVPDSMRGRGIRPLLSREVLNHFTQQDKYIDIRCPVTRGFVEKNRYAQYIRNLAYKAPARSYTWAP